MEPDLAGAMPPDPSASLGLSEPLGLPDPLSLPEPLSFPEHFSPLSHRLNKAAI
jgi:hypothetical protein